MRRVPLPLTTEQPVIEVTYVHSGAVRTAQAGRGGFRMNLVRFIRQEESGIAIYYDDKDGMSAVARFPYAVVRTIRLGDGEMVINSVS
jgi:hypothetical protein